MITDIANNFSPHPITGDLPLVKDNNSIGQEIRNLVNTAFYETPFQPSVGSQVSQFVFEPMSPLIDSAIKDSIINTLKMDARILDLRVEIEDSADDAITLTLYYYVETSIPEIQLNIILTRVR